MKKIYSTYLTDKQLEEIQPFGMRNRKWSKRELLDAVFLQAVSGGSYHTIFHLLLPYTMRQVCSTHIHSECR